MYPEGQVQMALPFTGLVSQLEPSLQGLLMQASFKWHSRPGQGGTGQRGTVPSLGMTGLPWPRCRAAPSGPRHLGHWRFVTSGPAPACPQPSSLQKGPSRAMSGAPEAALCASE